MFANLGFSIMDFFGKTILFFFVASLQQASPIIVYKTKDGDKTLNKETAKESSLTNMSSREN